MTSNNTYGFCKIPAGSTSSEALQFTGVFQKDSFDLEEISTSECVYSENENLLYLIRDKSGVSSIYYYFDNRIFIFSDSIEYILKHTQFKKEIDTGSLALYFKYRFIPTPYTAFKNLYSIEPGHYIIVNLTTGKVKKVKYWDVFDFYLKDKINVTEDEAVLEIEKILKNITAGLVKDETPGVLLTGGYDSSLASALLMRECGKVHTFTVSMEGVGFNEAPYAKRIADYLKTEHHEICIGASELKRLFEKNTETYAEPFGDIVSLPVMAFCSYAEEFKSNGDITSLFSGEGADEVFGGYRNHYNNIELFNKFVTAPLYLKKLFSFGCSFISSLSKKYENRTQKIKAYSCLNRIESYRLRSEPEYFIEEEISQLLNDPLLHKTYYNEIRRLSGIKDHMDILLAMDYKTILPDKNIYMVRNAAEKYGMRIKEIFSDPKLVEFVSRISSNFKYKRLTSKYVLKKITHKYIPEQLLKRDKTSSIPAEKWLNTFLKDYVFYYLDKRKVAASNILNPVIVESYVNRFYSNSNSISADKIWMLLTFQIWLEKWGK